VIGLEMSHCLLLSPLRRPTNTHCCTMFGTPKFLKGLSKYQSIAIVLQLGEHAAEHSKPMQHECPRLETQTTGTRLAIQKPQVRACVPLLQYVRKFSAKAAVGLLTGFVMVSGVASIPGESRTRQRGIQVAIICLGGCLLLPWGYPLTSGTSSQTLLATSPHQSACTICCHTSKDW